jgi:hypothetical protein
MVWPLDSAYKLTIIAAILRDFIAVRALKCILN